MALDDRDYMRRRAGRGADWKDAAYQPRAFRGRVGGEVPRASRPPTGSRAPWLMLALLVAMAIAAVVTERRDTKPRDGPVVVRPAASPPSIAPTAVPAPPPWTRPPQSVGAAVPPQASPPSPAPAVRPATDPYTSVYLCRSWQGAQFWSAEHCQGLQATLLRIHRVSSRLPWPQQVAIAQEEARQAARLVMP